MLKDAFGRNHDYLRLSLVDKCNLRCTYCMPENVKFLPQKKLMTEAEIFDIAKTFVEEFGINKIRLTGGEPLIRKNAAQIIESLSQLPVQLAITTNGILLDQFFDLFEKVGLKGINISLDTFDKQKFLELTRRDEYDKVMANIQQAIDRGFKVRLNMVVIRGQNETEILDFVERTRDQDLHVRFIEFMPFDGNQWKFDKTYSYIEMLADIRSKYTVEKLTDKANSTSKSFRVEGGKGTFAVISTVSMPFCGTCNRIRVTAEGKLRNCLFSTKEWDLLSAHRNGEDIRPLIVESIQNKAEKLGGLPAFEDEEALQAQLSDRAMVKIGG